MTAISIPLGGLRESRVWFDETPIEGRGTITVCRSAASNKDLVFLPRRIVVEVMIPVGFPMYGLLGASLEPSDDGFEVLVKSTPADGAIYPKALVPADVDEVRVGLSEEYVDAVREALQHSIQVNLGSLPQARIMFDVAAHGAAGSNNHVFGKLAVVVFESLLSREPATGTSVQRLLEAAF